MKSSRFRLLSPVATTRPPNRAHHRGVGVLTGHSKQRRLVICGAYYHKYSPHQTWRARQNDRSQRPTFLNFRGTSPMADSRTRATRCGVSAPPRSLPVRMSSGPGIKHGAEEVSRTTRTSRAAPFSRPGPSPPGAARRPECPGIPGHCQRWVREQ